MKTVLVVAAALAINTVVLIFDFVEQSTLWRQVLHAALCFLLIFALVVSIARTEERE